MTNVIKRLGSLSAAAASVGMWYACAQAPQNASEAKSLSNLEEQAKGGARTQTQCAGYNKVNAGIAADGLVLGANTPELKDAVMKTLTALPSSVSFNFAQWGGKVSLRDDLSTVCKAGVALLEEAGSSQVGGCMIVKEGEVTAYFKPDVNAIKYGLTRAMGYWVSAGSSIADVADDTLVFRKDKDPEISAYWDTLKAGFLAELKSRPGIDVNSATYKGVAELDSFVFYQEAFDSYNCDPTLRAKDTEAYPKTMALLAREAKGFDLIDKAAERALKTRDTADLDALGDKLEKTGHVYKQWQMTKLTVDHYLANNGAGLNLQTAKVPRVSGAPLMNLFRGGANAFRPGAAAGKI